MTKQVYMLPTPNMALNDTTNSINQIVLRLAKALPAHGYELVENEADAELIAGHAGASSRRRVDVAHCHGLYPTGEMGGPLWNWQANKDVIENLRGAKAITVPSQWVADLLRRDMHLDPAVIGWAIDGPEWSAVEGRSRGYVLWGKTRPDGVCNPATAMELARRVPTVPFISTFGENPPPNVGICGHLPFVQMQAVIHAAGVYLADVKETFGIMTLEAMACGVPVLGYRWGGTADIVQHGVTGYLVEPGDIDGLVQGLQYCIENRAILGANARKAALEYTWDRTARQIAAVYDSVLLTPTGVKVSIIIPAHNYARYIGEAIESVKVQTTDFQTEIIVVDDLSTDDTAAVARAALGADPRGTVVQAERNRGVAATRNAGIAQAKGQYIVCLDADDRLGDPRFLALLAAALDSDPTLGVVYTGLTMMDADGNHSGMAQAWPHEYDFDAQTQGQNQVPTCCMFRRAAWERAGGYRRAYEPAEDARLWLMIGALGYRAAQVTKEGWFFYRMHAGSLSSSVREGKKKSPDWLAALPWIKDKQRPFAADGAPTPNNRSWPVRNYDQPMVTFIVPVGPGHEGYLRDALDSLEAQTIRRWDCIVVNDTGAPLKPFGHPWARVIDTDGKTGAAHARNVGIRAAHAKLISFLDADDVLEPTFLSAALTAHQRTGRYVYTDWVSLSKEGRFEAHETPEYRPGDSFTRSTIHAINVVMPRQWALDVEGFDESMRTWEDVDFFMKLAAKGYCGVRVPEPLLIYRYTTGNLRERGESVKESLIAMLRERYHEYVVEGKEIVCCGNPAPKGQAMIAAAALMQPGGSDVVRIEYTGPRVGEGSHACIGPATQKNYGQRQKGETFLIYRADLLVAPDRFQEIANTNAPMPTEVPPPPVLQ